MTSKIETILKHEATLNQLEALGDQLRPLLETWEQLLPEYQKLMAYYGSPQWLADYEASNKGEFDAISCAILNQDAVYDLYRKHRDLSFKMMRTALDYLEH